MSMKSMKAASAEVGVSKHLHITHLNGPCIFELEDGKVGCTLKIEGVPFDTATADDLNSYKRTKHHAICMLGEEICVYEHTLRKKMDVHLNGDFSDDFTRSVDTKYHQQFKNTNLYANSLYITLIYKGIDSGKYGKLLNFVQRLSNKHIKDARDAYRQQAIKKLKKITQQFMATLSTFNPRLLGDKDNELGYSELLSFHGQIVNALDYTPFQNPISELQCLNGLKLDERYIKKYPMGNVSHYLPSHRIFFGDYIEFKKTHSNSKYGVMLSLVKYGTASSPIMIDKLLHLDCEYIETNTFSVEPNEVAVKSIKGQLIKMENANDLAESQKYDLVQCLDDLTSERLRVGYHHHTLMLIAHDISHLEEMINKAIKVYSATGFVAKQETIGQECAYWAQMPGNLKYIVRSRLITSKNFVDFCPLHNYRVGYRDKNHLGSAVTLIETPSKTPMFFNYHAKGSGDKNDLTPGHTTIIGGNGSGKTVFMGFMDSQMSRYGGRSFFFDRDRGMEIYVRATGGVYSVLSPDHSDSVKFNPFWLQDTAINRSFLKAWIGQLVKKEGEEELPALIDAQISECVDYAYDSLSKEHRTLTSATKILSIDFPRWDRLKKWLRSEHEYNDGEYAYLFDNDVDNLDVNVQKLGFDFTELMEQPKTVSTAVCMYLVHCIKASLDGQRVSIVFDEGWQILDSDYWNVKLKEDLPTLRKKNAHIILSTQSPASVVDSKLSTQFLDNGATNIFFCNEKANYEKHYKHFNLTWSEFDFIKNTPKELRLFLYKQGNQSAICKLNLSGLDNEMAIYSANTSTVELLDQIRNEVGDDPKNWIPLFHERRKWLVGA